MVKIIGIIGSPRKKGNTSYLVERSLEAAKNVGAEIESIHLGKIEIEPCNACDICKSTGECPKDDDINDVLIKLQNADGLIIGSPVYFGNVSSQLKILIDRSRPLRSDFKLKDKVCGAIAVGAARNGGQETTIAAIHEFLLIHDAIIVGDGAPLAHYGGTGAAGVAGDAKNDDFGIETSQNLGKRVAELARKING
ncbi:MAG: flavodoxin family protein [Methanobacterium sp.]|uniref:flavodoxin family protein n=1 Tax=Methanobacterium sp. TaxID=2164 RepID=UPI003D661275|nr:flavodoxin family protein [Methanobacterium sp.]